MKKPFVIVGAGPAGLSAACRVSEAGLPVTLLDEGERPGGQIYRQPPASFRITAATANAAPRPGQELLQRFERTGNIDYRPRCEVWGVFEGRTLGLSDGDGTRTLEAENLLLAPGTVEKVLPFPGWTLPGVMTTGGVQTQLKAQLIAPGHRFLIAGTGPLSLVLAGQLLSAGVEVVGVAELGSLADIGLRGAALLAQPSLLRQGLALRHTLKKQGVPIWERTAIASASGAEEVAQALLTRIDRQGVPRPGSEWTVDVDTVAIGLGFVPNIELIQQAGCRIHHAPLLGGWVPEVNAWRQSSVEGVYVAGDGAGVEGAFAAELQGHLAALDILRKAGLLTPAAAAREAAPLHRRLARYRLFRLAWQRMAKRRPALMRLCTAETIVCRCEQVRLAEILPHIADGSRGLDSLKRRCRVGMGYCQGRICAPIVAELVAFHGKVAPSEAGVHRSRPPVRPIPLASLAALAPQGANSAADQGEGAPVPTTILNKQ